jgi:hypothetical protein
MSFARLFQSRWWQNACVDFIVVVARYGLNVVARQIHQKQYRQSFHMFEGDQFAKQ